MLSKLGERQKPVAVANSEQPNFFEMSDVPAFKAKYTGYDSRSNLSHDEGISLSSRNDLIKSRISPHKCYCYESRPSTPQSDTGMQMDIPKFIEGLFQQLHVENLNAFDEVASQIYEALSKEICDIRTSMQFGIPIPDTTDTITSVDGSLMSCSLPHTPNDSNLVSHYSSEVAIEKDPSELVDKEIEVTKDQNIVLIPVQQNCDLHVMVQSTIDDSYTLITYDLSKYNQIDSFHRGSQELGPNKILPTSESCKAFYFNKKFSILCGELSSRTYMWNTKLYSLDTEGDLATWKLVSNFSPSISELLFDFHGCFAVSCKINEIIVVSIVKNHIIFHIMSKSIHGNKRSSVTFTLQQLKKYPTKFIMQSSIVASNYLYCSWLYQGVGAKIYQFKLQQKQNTTKVWLKKAWHIEDDLQNCFVSVHNKEVFIICSKVVDNKTFVEVKQLKSNPTAVISPKSSFEFSSKVKIITASVVPLCEKLALAVIYHNDEINKWYIKRIDMSSHSSMQTQFE